MSALISALIKDNSMRDSNSIFILGLGFIAGIVLVLSCGNDSPHRADAGDAASCNCPAAEPPLATRIIEATKPLIVPGNSKQQLQSVVCPLNAIVINGGCSAQGGQPADIVLEQSVPGMYGWSCSWRNPSNSDISVFVVAHCLTPAQ